MKLLKSLLFITVFIGWNAQAATVNLSTPPVVIGSGDTFVLELAGFDFDSGALDGGGVNISFDSSVVNVTNVEVDTALWEFFSSNGSIDNTAGVVDGIAFNSFQSRTGDLLFATIEFTAVGAGTSFLGLTENGLNPFGTGGSLYPGLILDQSASIVVSAVPVPAAVWLFGSGLVGLAGVVRRKNNYLNDK